MEHLIKRDTPAVDAVLNAVAYLPTRGLLAVVEGEFLGGLTDAEMMRVAVLLAAKSRREGGCPIGAVVRDNATGHIVGKGHNTLVQESHPYNHGETSAIRDAGRLDFSQTTLYTTLSPCDVCTALIRMRGFHRVVVGNARSVPDSAEQNHAALEAHGVTVDVLEDEVGVELYESYRTEHPGLDLEDWKGMAARSGSS